MGTYYGVKAVEEIGTPVVAVPMNEQPPIPTGNILVAVMCNGIWSIAPDVTDKKEYEAFVKDYNQGNWLKMRSYLVPDEQIKNCPDEGRVPCSM